MQTSFSMLQYFLRIFAESGLVMNQMDIIVDFSFFMRILCTILCGFIIGFERQTRGKPVGIRTSILITMGTMFYIYLSQTITEGIDVGRVLGQLVTGVGFLGGGVIMTRNDIVSGVTSAAVVWLLAAIGAAIGLQRYGVAVTVTVVAFLVLVGVDWMERGYKFLQRGVHKNIRMHKHNMMQ